jgi:GntR family transcriptional regulator
MAQFRLEAGPIPLHHQVYDDLRRALDAGDWAVGERLPPERVLAERYGCSLITVRRALSELAREERIERTRGRGTFVLPARVEHDFAGQLSFGDDVRRRGMEPMTRVVELRTEPAGELLAGMLGLDPGAPVVSIERLRLADGEPLLLERARLSATRFPGLDQVDFERESLYDVLAQRYGTQVVRSSETIEPIRLGAPDARLLGVRAGTLALLVLGTASTRAGVPVEYTRSIVRTDRTRYRLERSVHRPGWSRTLEPAALRSARSASSSNSQHSR